MTRSITTDHVEAYSLCPRKAFLLMTGAMTDPGPHDYELVVQEQAEGNRRDHRALLANAGQVIPFTTQADLALGHEMLVNAQLAAGGLQARCDSLVRVNEPSRLGKFAYEPVKVIGTSRA